MLQKSEKTTTTLTKENNFYPTPACCIDVCAICALENDDTLPVKTLHRKVSDLALRLDAQAEIAGKKLLSNMRSYRGARGHQIALRQAAIRLRRLSLHHFLTLDLRLALQDYLHCIEKCQIDAQEIAQAPHLRREHRGRVALRWRAAGELIALRLIHLEVELLVLKDICETNLWYLALDGKETCPFFEDEVVELGTGPSVNQHNELPSRKSLPRRESAGDGLGREMVRHSAHTPGAGWLRQSHQGRAGNIDIESAEDITHL